MRSLALLFGFTLTLAPLSAQTTADTQSLRIPAPLTSPEHRIFATPWFGTFQTRATISDPGYVFLPARAQPGKSVGIELVYERGNKWQFYLGAGYLLHYIGYYLDAPFQGFEQTQFTWQYQTPSFLNSKRNYVPNFREYTISSRRFLVGAGRKVYTPSNAYLFTLRAGAGLSLVSFEVPFAKWQGYLTSIEDTLHFTRSESIHRKWVPTGHIGISREFEVLPWLDFYGSWQYHFGWVTQHRSTFNYHVSGNNEIPERQATIDYRGGTHGIEVGARIRLVRWAKGIHTSGVDPGFGG